MFEGEFEGDFQLYLASLQDAFIGKLTAQTLPGTNQPLEWRHLLAWCIREQRTRFDGFFHWREGDGLGFRRSRQDPPLFVNSVLGLLDSDADRLMRSVETTHAEWARLEAQIPEFERQPIYALNHLEQRLRSQVCANFRVPQNVRVVQYAVIVEVQNQFARASHFCLSKFFISAVTSTTSVTELMLFQRFQVYAPSPVNPVFPSS